MFYSLVGQNTKKSIITAEIILIMIMKQNVQPGDIPVNEYLQMKINYIPPLIFYLN